MTGNEEPKAVSDFFRQEWERKGFSRAISVMLQTSVVAQTEGVSSVLEIGPGRGNTAALLRSFNLDYHSLDNTSHYGAPTYLAGLEDAVINRTFDAVLAFQVLEHFPLDAFENPIKKMMSYSNKYVIISLPNSTNYISLSMKFRLFEDSRLSRGSGSFQKVFHLPIFDHWRRKKNRDSSRMSGSPRHQWEIGDKGASRSAIARRLLAVGVQDVQIKQSRLNPEVVFFVARL